MAESSGSIKSLKQFREILESNEVDYRDSRGEEKEAVLQDIVEQICAACKKKGINVGSDISKVSILLSTQMDSESCFVD